MVSDIQVAKTLVKIIGQFSAILMAAGFSKALTADLLHEMVIVSSNENDEVITAVGKVINEVNEEMRAEMRGDAEPAFKRETSTARHEYWD
jgi:hypothetical protein